jgi:hypothetical protein
MDLEERERPKPGKASPNPDLFMTGFQVKDFEVLGREQDPGGRNRLR